MNRMVLSAQLLERGVVRYTPAGLPVIDCRLQHESTVTEDGQPRRISLEIKALAIGAIARPMSALMLGQTALYGGSSTSTAPDVVVRTTRERSVFPPACSSSVTERSMQPDTAVKQARHLDPPYTAASRERCGRRDDCLDWAP